MAKKSNTEELVDQLVEEPGQVTDEPQSVKIEPTYRMIGASRIPVSKDTGKLWKSRRDQSRHLVDQLGIVKAAEEAIAYYKNDQSTNDTRQRNPQRETASAARGFSRRHSQTENIVFANVSALVPATYAKNPDVEVSAIEKRELEAFASTCEKLINVLFRLKVAPGVNLKPKMRKGVTMTTLTNLCFYEVGYTKKADSSEQALADIEQLSQELLKAKDSATIMQVEGKIKALEAKVSLLQPAGPYVQFLDMRDVLGDPNVTLGDFSDGSYMMYRKYEATEMLRAMFGETQKDGTTKSLFNPTHVMKLGKGSGGTNTEEELLFSPFRDKGASYSDYGYDDEETFKFAQRTAVWYVWDFTTRRVMLFSEEDWSWPLWVWDDPYQLDTFFNVTPLAYYTDPEGPYARSEVMYYLDQQDEINKINSEIKRVREFATGKIIVNQKLANVTDVEALFKQQDDRLVVGVDMKDPAAKLSDAILALELPILKNPELLDKQSLFDAINRLSSVSITMRNQEFKTNTTNKAIEEYQSASNTRLDEKIDAIEDCIGDIGWKILQMCVRFMTPEEVGKLVGPEHIEVWSMHAIPENLRYMALQVVGGSALKPTARAKKEEAMQVGQILGQFANASPAAVLVLLKVMERAFDELTIDEADWQMIIESITSQMNKGRTDGSGSGNTGSGDGASGDGSGPSVEEVITGLDEIVSKLPPMVRKQLGEAIAKGATPSQAIEAVTKQG